MTLTSILYVTAIVDGKIVTLRVPATAKLLTSRNWAFHDCHALKKDPVGALEYVCAACGYEQDSMDPCQSCGSVRTVLVSVVRAEFGENWRDAFAPKDDHSLKLTRKR